MTALVDEVTDLLQQLIRNACVNDGTPESGQEQRSVDLLASYLEGSGLDIERYEPVAGRGSLIARIEGSDPQAPSLMLMGHTDVVPVNPDGWKRDPFGGELVDGEVWGRGAIDMLNETASMAVAFRKLADEGFTPKGTLIYLGVADEEALGTYGAEWLTEHELDAVRADYILTESGGFQMPLPSRSGPKMPVMVGEKGAYWWKIRVKGTWRPRWSGASPSTSPRPRSTTCGGGSWRGLTFPRRWPGCCSTRRPSGRSPNRWRTSAWPGWSTPARTRRSPRPSCTAG